MKRSTKAALLSGLVFPGVGHIYLKRYAIGILLALVAIVTTGIIITNAVHIASSIFDKILAGDVSPDVATVNRLLSKQAAQVEHSTDISTYLLFAAWMIGIVDSLRIGTALERSGQKPVSS